MLKKFNAYLILLSAIFLYYDFFNWYLSDSQLQIEYAFLKGALAFISALLFITYIHILYFPKLTNTPLIPTYPPLIMLFSLNIGFGIGISNLYVFQIYSLPYFFNFLRSPELGIGFMSISIILIYLSVDTFRKNNEDPNPTTASHNLITTGIFRYVRNPMYLSLVLFQFGVGSALSFLHINLMTLLTLLVLHFFVILREEKYLQREFGLEYETYLKNTRRWL